MLLGTFERAEKLRFKIIRMLCRKAQMEVTVGVPDKCIHFNLQMSVLVPLPEGELSPFSSSKQNS